MAHPEGAAVRVRIVLTDGVRTDVLYWIDHDGKDVYHGGPRERPHFSYHEDGTIYAGTKSASVRASDREPLGQFRRLHRLMGIAVGSEFAGRELHPYTGKQADAVAFIDTRAFPPCILRVSVGLLEPWRLDLLQALMKDLEPLAGPVRQCLIVSSVAPWVYVLVQAQGGATRSSSRPGLTTSSHPRRPER